MKAISPLWLALVLAFGAAAHAHSNKTIVLTEQTEKPVKARVGDSVEIRLKSQPGTGFSWSPKSDASNLSPLPPMKGQAIPGGWQTQRFRFLAKRAGTYRLIFAYEQPWSGGTKAARTERFTIIVR